MFHFNDLIATLFLHPAYRSRHLRSPHVTILQQPVYTLKSLSRAVLRPHLHIRPVPPGRGGRALEPWLALVSFACYSFSRATSSTRGRVQHVGGDKAKTPLLHLRSPETARTRLPTRPFTASFRLQNDIVPPLICAVCVRCMHFREGLGDVVVSPRRVHNLLGIFRGTPVACRSAGKLKSPRPRYLRLLG